MSSSLSVRASLVFSISLILLVISFTPGAARKTNAPKPYVNHIPKRTHDGSISLDRRLSTEPFRATAVPDTTWLGYWTFDAGSYCSAEGWTSVDRTDDAVYFHVDDFAGLGGGDFGRLVPIEGNQSMWCGARPDSTNDDLCSYVSLPGYGNSWFQTFTTVNCAAVTGDVTTDFLITWDSEPGYDGTRIQYDECDDNWLDVDLSPTYYWIIDGTGTRELISAPVPDSLHSGSLRLRFLFTSDGAWSDEDGSWNTDGALALDSLTVSDASGTLLPTELFETEDVGDQVTTSGNWEAGTLGGFGDFSGLYRGIEVLQRDACNRNLTCLWGFFNGSDANFGCGGYPDIAAVPYQTGGDSNEHIQNEIWSPWVSIAGAGNTFELGFDVYRDLPLDELVFYIWHVRSRVGNGCPSQWRDTGFVFHGLNEPDWKHEVQTIGDFIEPGATELQMSIGVIDMCFVWCGSVGSGDCHTNAPLFDNAWMRRIDTNGPAWRVRELDLFQDNFAADGSTTGRVRADTAVDIIRGSNPNLRPGDSTVVHVWDLDEGLGIDSYTGFGGAVYAYVGVWPQGQTGKTGDALTPDSFRWPVVDSLSYGGDTWYCVRMDTVFASPSRVSPQPDAFCVDLNDNLFTPGDTVCYFFAAKNASALTTYYSRHIGATDDFGEAINNAMEFTCLPVPRFAGGRHILYVDNYDGLGAQPFFDTAFEILGIADEVDRYDVKAPTTSQDNGLGSRVANPIAQLVSSYHTIIWNAGDIDRGALRDAQFSNEIKADDAAMLKTFLDNLPVPGGLYLSGDELAAEWTTLGNPGAIELRSVYMNFMLTEANHIDHGLGVSPVVIGVDDGCFDHTLTGPDTLIAFGGCPGINTFNVIDATGNSVVEAEYQGGGATGGAVLSQTTANPESVLVGVVLSGFSYHEIRDLEPTGIPARAHHLRDILLCLGNLTPEPTTVKGPVFTNSLAQNYPNPFNPATTVEFTLKERARVTIRVYNVAGQLVATLVDRIHTPGIVHKAMWNGTNRSGQTVASGVYFYKLTTKGYTKTRKMVLLK